MSAAYGWRCRRGSRCARQRSARWFAPCAAQHTRHFRGWACARVADLASALRGAGVEPATLGLTFRCSTDLSYPVVQRAGVEPAIFGVFVRCSTFEPTLSAIVSCRRRHTPRQCRAHRTGLETRTAAAETNIDCALPPVSKRQSICVAPRHGLHRGNQMPRQMRATSHCRVERFPCLGPACPDASGSRDARVVSTPLRMPKRKCPRHGVRGHSRFLGRIGATDLPWRESVSGSEICLHVHGARTLRHRAYQAMALGGWRWSVCATWLKFKPWMRKIFAQKAKDAHLTPASAKLQTKF